MLIACSVVDLTTPTRVAAIRPFVTDDARAVGKLTLQIETWLLVDGEAFEHNLLPAFGPTEWLELTAGLTHGVMHSGKERGYALTGPILQAKALLVDAVDDGPPGVAVAVGTLPPMGFGGSEPPGWNGFVYGAVTESLFEEGLLIHANIGITLAEGKPASEGSASTTGALQTIVFAGLGAQARIIAGLHAVAEIYHGDPYDVEVDYGNMQVGLRYIFSENVQLDGTFGSSLVKVDSDDGSQGMQHWATMGVRLVSPEL